MVMKAFPFGKKQAFSELVKRMAIFTTATIGFFLSIFLVFTSYHTFVPGKLSDITVSNGKQTVVFLQMSHIATPEFYQEKQKKLQSLEKQ